MEDDGYWRLQMWVARCEDDDDPAVFVHQRLINIPHKGGSDIFVDIASRSDMEEYAVDNPAEGMSFFRKKHADISLKDSEEMQKALQGVIDDLGKLVETYEVIS